MTIDVLPEPCQTCPYRKDVPSGVWSKEEYEKLRGFGDNVNVALFLCHQTNMAGHDILCKGWLMVERDSVAVRLAALNGKLDLPACFAPCKAKLYKTGNAAADAGEKQIERPGRKALKVIKKLKRTGRYES